MSFVHCSPPGLTVHRVSGPFVGIHSSAKSSICTQHGKSHADNTGVFCPRCGAHLDVDAWLQLPEWARAQTLMVLRAERHRCEALARRAAGGMEREALQLRALAARVTVELLEHLQGRCRHA
jgi:hypothetical protein